MNNFQHYCYSPMKRELFIKELQLCHAKESIDFTIHTLYTIRAEIQNNGL